MPEQTTKQEPVVDLIAKQLAKEQQELKHNKVIKFVSIPNKDIRPGISKKEVNFNQFLYNKPDITTNFPDPKTIATLALKLANNIRTSSAKDPPVASTFMLI